MESRLQVGVITTTHGIRVEVKVFPTTDDPKRFKKLKKVILEENSGEIILEIESVKFFKNLVILKFKNIDSINDVEKYKGKKMFIDRKDAVKLNRNEYFIADLIGCQVVDEEDNTIGILKDVLETGANDVYIVTNGEGRELLFPAIKECILNVDVVKQVIKVHVMPGLID